MCAYNLSLDCVACVYGKGKKRLCDCCEVISNLHILFIKFGEIFALIGLNEV